jgi:hypothetical protein
MLAALYAILLSMSVLWTPSGPMPIDQLRISWDHIEVIHRADTLKMYNDFTTNKNLNWNVTDDRVVLYRP